jgi:hypothetical protein
MSDPQPTLGPRPEWHERAACRHLTPDDFYRRERETEAEWATRSEWGRAHCQICPVRQECWTRAVVNREPDGIWSGVEFPGEYRTAMRLRR